MIRKFLWVVLGLCLVAPIGASLAGIKLSQFKAMGAAAALQVPPPEPVNVAEVREEDWQPRIPSVGSIVAVQGTVVSAEAEGVVREIKFKEGSAVKAGDVLIHLDIDIEQAQLRAAEAAAALAAVSYKRSKELVESRSVSQQEFDTAQAGIKQAVANVENLKAVIAKKTVRAPFSGTLGLRQVNAGQFITKGAPVVSLQSLHPLHVEFSLPQQRLRDVAEGLKVAVTSDAYPGQTFEGKITAIDPDVDVKTRNVRVQATLDNTEGRLRPGMFVSLDMLLAKRERVLFIPETAVLYAPYGDSVFVLEEGATNSSGTKELAVRQEFVRLGARQGDFIVATSGVKAGDRIVSTGVFKLRPGAAVVIDNKLAPDFKLDPAPGNT